MYTYTAGATGLDAAMPPWVQEGGLEAWIKRLKDPAIRARAGQGDAHARRTTGKTCCSLAGGPDKVLLVGFKNPKLKPLTGKTLAEVAKMRGKCPEDTAMDLVIEDGSRVGTVYFLMTEDNVEARDRAAVGELRLGRSVAGARRRVPEVEHAPARLRQLRAPARQLRARRACRRRWRKRSAG